MVCWILLSFVFSFQFTEGIALPKLNEKNNFDFMNCTLLPEKNNMRIKLDKLIKGGNRLIQLDITVNWTSQPTNASYPQNMKWYLTTDYSGTHLLMLDENFIAMSLGALSYGIAEMPIRFKQEPEDCLGNMTGYSAEELLQISLLTLPAKSSEYYEEDGFSPFCLCTGSARSNGSCCNLTLSSSKFAVKCAGFQDDDWIKYFIIIMTSFSSLAILHCTYLIPKSVYENNEQNQNETYQNDDRNLLLSLLVVKGGRFNANENWLKVTNNMFPLLKTIFDNLMEMTTPEGLTDESQGVGSDKIFRTYTICTHIESVTKRSDELVSEISTSHALLHSLRKTLNGIRNTESLRPYCYGKPFSNWVCFTKSHCWNILCAVCIILLCFTPSIFTVTVILKYSNLDVEVVFIISALSFLICSIVGIWRCTRKDRFESWFVKSLQEINEGTPEEEAKSLLFAILSPIDHFGYFGVIFVPITLIFSVVFFFIFSLPLVRFSLVSVIHLTKTKVYVSCTIIVAVCLIWLSAVFICVCVYFYTTCLAYLFLGFFLNFDQLIDKVLLIAMVFIYARSCISRVYRKIDSFNQKVFEIVRELCSNYQDVYDRALEEKRNVAKRTLSQDNEEATASARFFKTYDGKIIMCSKGLLLFYKYQETDRLPYLHIPKSFLDQLMSEPGHLTPGSKYFLLYTAFKEMIIVLISASAMFVAVHGFGGRNDTSTIIHNLVTVGGSGTLMFFINKFFKSNEYIQGGHEMQIKALINRHLNTFQDSFQETDVRYISSELRGTWNERTPIFSDYDVVINVFENDRGQEMVGSCYLKTSLQDEQFTPCPSFGCTRCSICCQNAGYVYDNM